MGRDITSSYAAPAGSIPLEWPRSDGSLSRHPEQPPVPNDGTVNFYREVDPSEPSHLRWRCEVANRMATHVSRLDPKKKYMFTSWPAGYGFYDHIKGPRDSARHDLYLYGSTHCTKFRSVNEFVPHAIWLFRENEAEQCGCKYCSKVKYQAEVSAQFNLPAGLGKEPPPPPIAIRKVVKPAWIPAPFQSVPRARDADLRAAAKLERRYRIGELVWCQIDPPIVNPTTPSLFLEFWPAVVREIRFKSKLRDRKPLSPSPSPSPGSSKAGARAEYVVEQTYSYKVQLIGVGHMHIMPESDIVPYMSWNLDDGLIDYLKDFGRAQLPANLSAELRELHNFSPMPQSTVYVPDPVSSPPSEELFPPPPNPPQGEWKDALGPFSLALQISAFASNYWALTDEWDFRPKAGKSNLPKNFDTAVASATASAAASTNPSPSSSPLKPPYQEQQQQGTSQQSQSQSQATQDKQQAVEVRYQGIWWGAERIWQGDLVRLIPFRDQLQIDELLPPSPQAETRTVFMRLDSIFIDPTGAHPRGRIAGALFELAPADWVPEVKPTTKQPDRAPLSAPSRTPYALPPPPRGFVFRCITPPGLEVVLDIAMLSGRYYPDLLTTPPMLHKMHKAGVQDETSLPPDSEMFSTFEQLLGLAGLTPSYKYNMGCVEWKPSRADMLNEADSVSRMRLYSHWFDVEQEDDELMMRDPPMEAGADESVPMPPSGVSADALTIYNASGADDPMIID